MNKFKQDLGCIDRVIEESISLYKQEIFWDNLSSSMSPLTDILNETNMSVSSISFSVNSHELEQILAISEKVDILDLDASLSKFLRECYSIREKIRDYVRFSFGRHFICTSSPSVEYCLLLINDELIKNFKETFATSSTSSSVTPSSLLSSQASSLTLKDETFSRLTQKRSNVNAAENSELKSFVLLKFDMVNQMSHIIQVNRVKVSANEPQGSKSSQSQLQTSATILAKRASTTETLSSSQLASLVSSSIEHSSLSSSLKNVALVTSAHTGVKSHKYLNFAINTLMYVLWESVVSSS